MLLQEDERGPDLLHDDKDRFLASKLVRSHFLPNVIALRSSVPLPTSLRSFPNNIHCPARLCSPCQSKQENLDENMSFASSSPHLLPTRTSCRIPCLKAIASPRAPSHLPPYASASQSARQEPTRMRRPHSPAHVRLVRNLFHPHRPTGRRDGLEVARSRPSDADNAFRLRTPQPRC